MPISIFLLYFMLFIHIFFMGGWLVYKMFWSYSIEIYIFSAKKKCLQ